MNWTCTTCGESSNAAWNAFCSRCGSPRTGAPEEEGRAGVGRVSPPADALPPAPRGASPPPPPPPPPSPPPPPPTQPEAIEAVPVFPPSPPGPPRTYARRASGGCGGGTCCLVGAVVLLLGLLGLCLVAILVPSLLSAFLPT
ncbi:MAG: hypothetical protein ACOYXN_12035 [Acidobacteriota bacterium]